MEKLNKEDILDALRNTNDGSGGFEASGLDGAAVVELVVDGKVEVLGYDGEEIVLALTKSYVAELLAEGE